MSKNNSSSRNNAGIRFCPNIHAIGSSLLKIPIKTVQPAKGSSTNKSHDAPLDINRSFIVNTQKTSNPVLFSNACLGSVFKTVSKKEEKQSPLQSLLSLLETVRSKSNRPKSTTPSSKASKLRLHKMKPTNVNTSQYKEISEEINNMIHRPYTPNDKSCLHKIKLKKTNNNNKVSKDKKYETLSHSFINMREPLNEGFSVLCKNAEQEKQKIKLKKLIGENNENLFLNRNNEDPYNDIGRSGILKNIIKTRNGPINSSKTIDVDYSILKPAPPVIPKGEDNKKRWRRYLEESTDNGSETTNKSSLLVGKTSLSTNMLDNEEEKNDGVESEERLTVIENDCENDYDLICKSLQSKYYQA